MRTTDEMRGWDGYCEPVTIEELMLCFSEGITDPKLMGSVVRELVERLVLLENIVAEALPGLERLSV
jgi:hypothetical protein